MTAAKWGKQREGTKKNKKNARRSRAAPRTRAEKRRWQCTAEEEQLWRRGIGVGQALVKKGLKLWSLSVPKSQATRWGGKVQGACVCVCGTGRMGGKEHMWQQGVAMNTCGGKQPVLAVWSLQRSTHGRQDIKAAEAGRPAS